MDYSKLSNTEIILFEQFASNADYVPNVNCANEEHRQACLEYQRLANAMPYELMKDALQEYDNSHPKMDEIKFVRDIQKRFAQNESDVLTRIRHIRKFMKLQEALKKNDS